MVWNLQAHPQFVLLTLGTEHLEQEQEAMARAHLQSLEVSVVQFAGGAGRNL